MLPSASSTKLPGIIPYARATGIHSRTLEIFDQLGIVDEVLARGQKILGMNQYANGKRFQHIRFAAVDSPYPFAIALEQWHTEKALEGLLTRLGVEVQRETELVDLSDLVDGVRATLRRADGSKEVVETPWLVACDGAHSTVRHLNHQHFPGEADPLQYALGDVVVEPLLEQDEVFFFLTEGGALMVFPLPDGRKLVMVDVAQEHDGRWATPPFEELEALVDERTERRLRVRDPRWLSYFRIHYRVARRYAHGRTLLAGDAVHVNSPLGGLGMNTGIQDAYNLAWKLALVARGRAPDALLESYEKERRAVAEDMVATTRAMTDQVEDFRHLSRAERERLSLHVRVSEPDRMNSAEHREELDLDYRKSPICTDHRARALVGTPPCNGPRAGAQARDVAPLFVRDRRVTLFGLLRGPRHALLLFAGVSSAIDARARLDALATEVARRHGDLIDVYLVDAGREPESAPTGTSLIHDRNQELQRRYGAQRDCLYLIRPDGYIGFRSEPAELSVLRRYLDRVFAPRASH